MSSIIISDFAAFNCLGWYCRDCTEGDLNKNACFKDLKQMKKHLIDVHHIKLNDIPTRDIDLKKFLLMVDTLLLN